MATAKKNEQSTELKQNDAGALAVTPDWLKQSSRGSEDVGMDDIILPRIDVLQALSPQIKKKDDKYIEGAEQGMVFNTVTGELYGDRIRFIPVKFSREYIIWQDRDSGGGFRGAFQDEDEAEAARRNMENPDLLEVVETHVHYVLLVLEGGKLEEAVLSLSKSKRKVSRKLNTLVAQTGYDRFAKQYELRAVEVSGPKGDYWSFDVVPVGFATQDQFKQGEKTYEAIVGGQRKIDRTADEADEGGARGSARL